MPNYTLLTLVVLFFGAALVFGMMSSAIAPPEYRVGISRTPAVEAIAWGVYDITTGERLVGRNERTPLPIASVTKLMTASAALQTLDTFASTTISTAAVSTEGRAGRLRAGEMLTMHELLFPLLLESSNDAAVALAESAPQSVLLDVMYVQSRELGMHDTELTDTSGLSAGNISTVRDLALFVEYLSKHNQHVLDITRLPTYIGREHTWINNNPLIETDGYRGGKHGFTDEAGRTVVALFGEEINGTEKTLLYIVLGSENILEDVTTLRQYVQDHITYE